MIEQYLDAVENTENRQMAAEVIQKWATLKDDFAKVDDGMSNNCVLKFYMNIVVSCPIFLCSQ